MGAELTGSAGVAPSLITGVSVIVSVVIGLQPALKPSICVVASTLDFNGLRAVGE